jgi:hypothetical protein
MAEHQFAQRALPNNTDFQRFGRASRAYALNPRQFTIAKHQLEQLHDPGRWLVAYAAMATAQWSVAANALRHVRSVELKDMLALSYAPALLARHRNSCSEHQKSAGTTWLPANCK